MPAHASEYLDLHSQMREPSEPLALLRRHFLVSIIILTGWYDKWTPRHYPLFLLQWKLLAYTRFLRHQSHSFSRESSQDGDESAQSASVHRAFHRAPDFS